MRLRSITRPPKRYLDGDHPDIRRRASFIQRTSCYNPDLPPAVFPTLEYPLTVESRISEVAARSIPDRVETPDDDIQLKIPSKKATVFHAKEDSNGQVIQGSSLAPARSRQMDIVELDPSKFSEWNSSNNRTDLGEYDGWQAMANSSDMPRDGLSAYELTQGWSQISDDMKLVLFREIMVKHSFSDAAEMLMLTDAQRNNIVALFRRETAREARDNAKIVRVQATQLRMLMSGGPEISREALSGSFEDLYMNIDVPAASRVSKTDITHAQRFLTAVKLNEYMSHLWHYEGVALDLVDWNISFIEGEPSNTVESVPVKNQRQYLPASRSVDAGLDVKVSRKKKALLGNVGGLTSIKRKHKGNQIAGLSIPSRLRNCVLHNPEGKRTAESAATQASLSPDRQFVMQTPLHPKVEKQHMARSLRLVVKSSTKYQPLDTPKRYTSNKTEDLPDSFRAKQPEQPWSLRQSNLSNRIFPRADILPQLHETRPNPLEADSGQLKNFTRENIKDGNESLISEKERNAAIMPMMKASLMVIERTAITSGHTNFEANSAGNNNECTKNVRHISAGSVSALQSQPNQKTAAQVEENTLSGQHRLKRLKTERDDPWRVS